MKKLNNKGYLTIEIILSAVIAFTIAFFLIEITINFSNASDNYYTDTIFITDKALVSNNVKKNIQNDINDNGIITNVSCTNNTCAITYNDNTTKELKYNSGNKKVEYDTYNKEVKNLTIKSINVYGSYNEGDYIRFVISFDNVFEKNNYDINILIYNGNTEKYELLVEHIVDLYENSEKRKIENKYDFVDSVYYNYAISVNLMNDRLGGTTENLDGGNIRYFGAEPNNYIDIGDRTIDDEVILWRIIGVFDGKLRIVRDESIGEYSWDISSLNYSYGINEWSQADLMKLLNPDYDENEDKKCIYNERLFKVNCVDEQIKVNNSLWWNSKEGFCYNKDENIKCDFTSSGISQKAKEHIVPQTIYLGGVGQLLGKRILPDKIYLMERNFITNETPKDGITRTAKWTGMVGLMYLSDYGYAVDFTKCNNMYRDNENDSCKNNNWMVNGKEQWLNTPAVLSYSETSAWTIPYNFGVYYSSTCSVPKNTRPVVTLSSDLLVKSSDEGTKENPYKIIN